MVECSLNLPRNNLQGEHHALLSVLFEGCFHADGDFEGLPILAHICLFLQALKAPSLQRSHTISISYVSNSFLIP
jgi:hypothetical protein